MIYDTAFETCTINRGERVVIQSDCKGGPSRITQGFEVHRKVGDKLGNLSCHWQLNNEHGTFVELTDH